MPRSGCARVLSILLALLATSAVPVGAWAHGFAHGHERHHAEHPASLEREVEAPEHTGTDHGHAEIGVALLTKLAQPAVPLTAPRVVAPLIAIVVPAPPAADVAFVPRARSGHSPPPTLRAPPRRSV